MIIAVDFDGVLCEDRFPDIGRPKEGNLELMRELMADGHELVLWTSRVDERLAEAIEWCEGHGLHFEKVNELAESNARKYAGQYSMEPRKIYADLYIDDHCVLPNTMGIRMAVKRTAERLERCR